MSRNMHCSNNFEGCSLTSVLLYCYHFLPFTLHESGTSKADHRNLYNTFCNPQDHVIAGLDILRLKTYWGHMYI